MVLSVAGGVDAWQSFGQCEVNNTSCSSFACLTEMGVMPEIAQAVEEMDWL